VASAQYRAGAVLACLINHSWCAAAAGAAADADNDVYACGLMIVIAEPTYSLLSS